MSGAFPSQPPQTWSRLRETAAAGAVDVDQPLGELCRVLAASRPGGVFLSLGDGAGGIGIWILDGMDLSSRLVVVVGGEEEAGMLRARTASISLPTYARAHPPSSPARP
jgi:hypothetical protein